MGDISAAVLMSNMRSSALSEMQNVSTRSYDGLFWRFFNSATCAILRDTLRSTPALINHTAVGSVLAGELITEARAIDYYGGASYRPSHLCEHHCRSPKR